MFFNPAAARLRSLTVALLAMSVSAGLLVGCKGSSDANGGAATGGDAGTNTAAKTGTTGNTIVVGEYGSMTGPTATFGVSTDNGIQLAVGKINAAGGALGKQIEIDAKDDGGNADAARSVVEALVGQNVVAVLGEVASTQSLKGAPVCQDKHIPMISPASTNPKVTQVGDYIFRVCFIDPFQGGAMASIGTDILHARRGAILFDNASDYSKGLKDVIEQAFPGKGGQIVVERSYTAGDSDFSGQLTAIAGAKPDVVFVPGYYTEVAKIARQARDLGITATLVGGDGWDSADLTKDAGSALNNCYFTDHFSPDDTAPAVQNFVKEFKARYNGKAPDAMSALGYDAMGVLADAMKRAKSTDGPALRDAITSTKNYPGVTGSITINADRNAVKPVVVIKIVNGKFTFFKRIQPS